MANGFVDGFLAGLSLLDTGIQERVRSQLGIRQP
jgi:hypothetical protein